jgi:hypothetical protein
MEAVAHNSEFAKKAGVPQSVGKDFSDADKGKRFAGGGTSKQKINLQNTRHGAMDMPFKSLRKFAGMKAGGDIPNEYRKGREMKEKMMKGSNMPKMEPRMAAMRRPTQVSAAMPGMSSMMKKGGMAHGGMHKMPNGKMMKNSAMNMGGMAKYAGGGSIRRMADGGMTAPMGPMAPQAPVDPRQLAAMQAAMQAQGGAPMAPPPAPMPPPAPGMKRGGSVKFAKGGGIESRGKTKGTIIRMASGGSVSSASRRADGIAQRGKTRG